MGRRKSSAVPRRATCAGTLRREAGGASRYRPLVRCFSTAGALTSALLGLVALGCAPTLVVTRTVGAIDEASGPVRRVAVQVKGTPAMTHRISESLSQALAASGRFEVVALERDGTPSAPVDAIVRSEAAQVSVTGAPAARAPEPGLALPEGETRVIVELAFEIVRPDGTVLATRRHDTMKSTPGVRGEPLSNRVLQDATENRLLRDAVDECVREFVKELVPTERTVRFELEDEGPLEAPVKQALAGDRAGAETALEALVARQPNEPGAHYDLGVLAEARGELEVARRHYERACALAKKPRYEKALAAVGRPRQ